MLKKDAIFQEQQPQKIMPMDAQIIVQTNTLEPTQQQLETLARRLLPEIKKFYANSENQLEFERWKARETQAK